MKRETWVDLLKGIAIFLVVVGHLNQSFVKANIWQQGRYIYEYLDYTIYTIHMPVFFMLSGYLFHKTTQINNIKEYKNFILKKGLNLIIPYVSFSMLYIVVSAVTNRFSKTNSEISLKNIPDIIYSPILHLWFLYILFAIFLLVPIFHMLLKNKYLTFGLLLALKVLVIVVPSGKPTNIFFIDGFMKWAVFFYLGIILTNAVMDKEIIRSGTLAYIIFNIIYYVFWNTEVNSPFKYILYFLLSVLGIALAVDIGNIMNRSSKVKSVFEVMGKYSMQIYLLHTLFSSCLRILLVRVGIHNLYIHMVLGLIAGIIFPLVVAVYGAKISIVDFWFNPTKYIIKKNNVA